ncbi:MAG TPA: hypothetical protein VLM76_10170 [Patescibacteria group bacterium]|nr:hypothetical protein [Patescibacteria group bacterium]
MSAAARSVLALVLLATVAIGCIANPERLERARAAADGYLTSVSRGSGDRGWSLIAPEIRVVAFSAGQAAYLRQVEASDWSTFRYEITDVVLDDPTLALITVALPNGPASVPRVLRDAHGWAILGIRTGEQDEALLTVRLTVSGDVEGIWAGGG